MKVDNLQLYSCPKLSFQVKYGNFFGSLIKLIFWVSGPGVKWIYCAAPCEASAHPATSPASLPLWASYSTSQSSFCRTHTPTPHQVMTSSKTAPPEGVFRTCRETSPACSSHAFQLEERSYPEFSEHSLAVAVLSNSSIKLIFLL